MLWAEMSKALENDSKLLESVFYSQKQNTQSKLICTIIFIYKINYSKYTTAVAYRNFTTF